MQIVKRVFLASLFFTTTVLVAIWFYPAIESWFSGFNSSVQGGIGSSAYVEAATGALDIGAALLCTSALFYGAMLAAKRGKAETLVSVSPAPSASRASAADGRRTRLRRRLLLIPAWLVFLYGKNLLSGMTAVGAFEAMTSVESLFFSAVVAAVVVLYANGYGVSFGEGVKREPRATVKSEK